MNDHDFIYGLVQNPSELDTLAQCMAKAIVGRDDHLDIQPIQEYGAWLDTHPPYEPPPIELERRFWVALSKYSCHPVDIGEVMRGLVKYGETYVARLQAGIAQNVTRLIQAVQR